MKRLDTWKSVLLLLMTLQVLRLRGFVQAYRRMSIAVNASTVNPHYWYRQSPLGLPSWYTHSSTTFRNHKVFQLRFLIQSDVRCNDGTRAGLVTLLKTILPLVRVELAVGSKASWKVNLRRVFMRHSWYRAWRHTFPVYWQLLWCPLTCRLHPLGTCDLQTLRQISLTNSTNMKSLIAFTICRLKR